MLDTVKIVNLCLKVLTEFSNGYGLSRRCLMTLLMTFDVLFFLTRICCNMFVKTVFFFLVGVMYFNG